MRVSPAFWLSLSLAPAWAADHAGSGAPKDLCAFLQDVEAKPETACAPEALAALKARDEPAFAHKLARARERKTGVRAAYDRLKAAGENGPPDGLRLDPPINERTFPVWIGPEEKDFNAVYGRWLQTQKQALERERQGPISAERRQEIDRTLVRNQTAVSTLERLKDPSQLSCYHQETCGSRGETGGPSGAGAASSRRWTAEDFARANAASTPPLKLPVRSRNPTVGVPPLSGEPASPAPATPPVLPVAAAGLALAAAGRGLSRTQDQRQAAGEEATWQSAVKSFAIGAGVGLVSAAAVGGVAVLAVTLGAPAIVVTGALGVVAVAGGVMMGFDVYDNIRARNWNGLAYDAGAVAGGILFGAAGGGRFVANGVSPTPSAVPSSMNPLGDWAWRFNPSYPGGSISSWLGSGPTPQSGGGVAALGGVGVSQAIRPVILRQP